jgi:Tfp pilus assembly protein PilN
MIKKFPKKRTPATALGLALDGSRLTGAVVRRSNGSLRVLKTFFATLTLNPLNSDPALVGRELRNHLDAAGIKERNCVFCIPLAWALSIQVKVPNIPESDIQSFLDIEAERGFPYGPETLSIANSICGAAAEGEKQATLVAVPKNHLLQLERVVRAAQLRPMSFTFGVTALHGAERDSQQGILTLFVGENSIDLQISINGGVAALRSLDGAIEVEGAQKSIDAAGLAREIRVTLGQLPMELRGSIRTALIFGESELAQRLVRDIAPHLQNMGMNLDWRRAYASDAFRSQFPANTTVAPELSATARFLTGGRATFELLPPKVSAWQQLTARVSSKKLGWVGVAAAAILVIAGGAIGIQQWKLSKLQKQWASMESRVKTVDDTQAKIRKYRAWFDESLPSLSILKRVTEAFPAEGTIWTKTVEIRNQATVNCSGTARNNEALMKTLDQLRASSDVSNVSVDSVRGTAPLQFTFNFQWTPGGGSEN